MNIRHIFKLFFISSFFIVDLTHPFVATNFFRPYDQAIRVPFNDHNNWQVGFFVESGEKSHGRTPDNEKANVLALYDAGQNVISMLNAPADTNPEQTTISCIRNTLVIGGPVADNGNVGLMSFRGKFSALQAHLMGAYRLPITSIDVPGIFALKVFLPIVHKKIKDLQIKDLATNDDFGGLLAAPLDKPLIDQIKNNLAQLTNTLGEGLNISEWSKTGLGDLAVMLEWQHWMRQYKDYLKEVTIIAQAGFSCPTGSKRNENQAFSMPLGTDGAWGVPFGMGIDLGFTYNIHAGINADFVALFDKTHTRRLKTDRRQTDFLLLNKGRATKEYGFSWQFHLYLGAHRFFNGLSTQVAYQFLKHDSDHLTATDNKFNSDIINATLTLREMTSHNLIFKLGYDHTSNSSVSLFVRVPVGGKNIIDPLSIGGQIALNF